MTGPLCCLEENYFDYYKNIIFLILWLPVHENAQVGFSFDINALGNHHFPHFDSVFWGLLRDQLEANHFFTNRVYVLRTIKKSQS